MSFTQATPLRVPREYWQLQAREYAFVVLGVLAWVLMSLTLRRVLQGLGLAGWEHEVAAQLGILALAALSSWFGVQAGWNALGLPDVTRTRQRLARHLPKAFFIARRLSSARLQKFGLLAYFEGRHRSLTLLQSALMGSVVVFAPYILASIGFPGVSAGLSQTYPLVTLLIFPLVTMIHYLARRADWNGLQAEMDRISQRDEPASSSGPISVDASSWTG